jgi:hypothetical protein
VIPNLSEDELEEIRAAAAKSQGENSPTDDWAKLMSGTCKPALIAACGLVFLQQVTGQPR